MGSSTESIFPSIAYVAYKDSFHLRSLVHSMALCYSGG